MERRLSCPWPGIRSRVVVRSRRGLSLHRARSRGRAGGGGRNSARRRHDPRPARSHRLGPCRRTGQAPHARGRRSRQRADDRTPVRRHAGRQHDFKLRRGRALSSGARSRHRRRRPRSRRGSGLRAGGQRSVDGRARRRARSGNGSRPRGHRAPSAADDRVRRAGRGGVSDPPMRSRACTRPESRKRRREPTTVAAAASRWARIRSSFWVGARRHAVAEVPISAAPSEQPLLVMLEADAGLEVRLSSPGARPEIFQLRVKSNQQFLAPHGSLNLDTILEVLGGTEGELRQLGRRRDRRRVRLLAGGRRDDPCRLLPAAPSRWR